MSAAVEIRGLPVNLEAEKFLLGTVIQDDTRLPEIATVLSGSDFSLTKHRRIFDAMGDMAMRGDRIDRVTLAEELMRRNQLESVDGLSYLVSLDDGIPRLAAVDGYIRIVKDKSLKRQIIFSGQRVINEAALDEDDASELLKRASEDFIHLADDLPATGLMTIPKIIESIPGGFEGLIERGNRDRGVPTGFTKFDELTSGFQNGELIILAARPSMGKTAIALNMAAYAASERFQKRVAIFSLESSRESLLTRLLCASARVDGQKLRTGRVNAEEMRRLAFSRTQLEQCPIVIDDTPALGVMDLMLKLRRAKAESGVDFAIVDYLQLMQTRHTKGDSRNLELGELTRGLKLLAGDLGIPILVLSQLSRATEIREDHKPRLSDLRESGNIEQDADVVAFVYREEVYKTDREDLRGKAELILSKQRNGPTGTVGLVFLKEYTRFENPASDFE